MASTNVLTAGLGGISAPTVANISRAFDNSKNDNGGHYVYWIGQDGNIWVNKDGNTYNIGKPVGDSWKNGYADGTTLSMAGKGTLIDDPNPGNGNATGQGGVVSSSVDSALAAANADKARRASEAQSVKDSMLGKRDQVENMLKDILANIKSVYDEEKTKRDEQYEGDSSALIDQLNQALPDIGSSFAAIGAYDSSWNNDAQGRTKEEHNKAQEEIKKEYDADMVTLGDKKNQAETNARNARDNFMIDFDTFNETEANSDNLENLRASKNSLIKAMNDFNAQGDYFKPGSTLQKEMSGLGSYNGQQVRDSFDSFLKTAGAGGSGVEATEASGNSLKANKNKKEKTEIEQNQATGVSK